MESPYWNPRVETLPRPTLEALQLAKLRELIAWTLAEAPWQAGQLRRAGVEPDSIRTMDDVRRLPFLTREDWMASQIAGESQQAVLHFDSLRRLLTLDCRLLLPAHGGPSSRPRQTLEEAIAHRAKREEMLEASKREIQAETRRAIQDIRNEVADLTILATEKVTRKSLSDDDQRRLVEDALSELDFSALAGERK